VGEKRPYLEGVAVVQAGGNLGVVHDEAHSIIKDALLSLTTNNMEKKRKKSWHLDTPAFLFPTRFPPLKG